MSWERCNDPGFFNSNLIDGFVPSPSIELTSILSRVNHLVFFIEGIPFLFLLRRFCFILRVISPFLAAAPFWCLFPFFGGGGRGLSKAYPCFWCGPFQCSCFSNCTATFG